MPHRFARSLLPGALLSFALVPAAFAQSTAPSSTSPAARAGAGAAALAPIRDEAPVTVTGTQPGPGLWKVAKGDHVLWVLGTQSPLPRRMQWHSTEVEDAIAASQEVPKVYAARKNPDGKTLRDVLPPALYARWLPLREHYLGRGASAERMRPLFAAGALWEEAMDDNDLAASGIVMPLIRRAVKAHGLRETSPKKILKITDPKALLAEMEHAQLEDTQCLEATVQRLEAGPDRLKARANAWAIGDIAALRALPDTDQNGACADAAMESPALRKRGGAGIDAEVERVWLDAAEKALAGNASTFAVLPIGNLLSVDGYLSKLAARGYEVTEPE